MQCSWIKRLFDNSFHQWKVIPLYPICQYLGKKNHSNLEVSHSILWIIKYFAWNLSNLYLQDHFIKCNTIYNLEKLNSRELYHMQLLLKYDKYLCQDYHKRKFDEYDFIWILIFMIPHIATYEIKIHIFQYKP